MPKQEQKAMSYLKHGTLSVSKFHILFLVAFSVQTIIYHASKVAVPEVIHERWLATAALAVVATLTWYIAKNHLQTTTAFKMLLWTLVIADLAFAAFAVNLTRGYASNYVLLFFIPLLAATALKSRSGLIAVGFLSAIIYAATALNYFFQNFNEGYMAELYGEVILYSGIFIAASFLLWSLIKPKS